MMREAWLARFTECHNMTIGMRHRPRKFQIEKRLNKIKEEGYFGHIRDLGDELVELKFNDGRRIYYTTIPVNNVILLLGGNKNGQDSDIRKAKNIIEKAKKRTHERKKE